MHKPVLISLVLALGAPAAAAPSKGARWDWQLGEPLDISRDVRIFDTDPDTVTPAQMHKLAGRGIYTICYVSVGTLEDYRDDKGAFPPAVVGKVYGDWPDERFLDIRRRDILLPLMRARFQRCKTAGFDAVEPDNMDVYTNDSGFDIDARDTLAYLRALADMAHGMGLEIGQKNVPELTGALHDTMDFIITESCYQDGWCADVAPYLQQNKPVLDAEYTDRPVNWAKACEYAQKTGISMILKDRDLTAELKTCP